ncbi:MAG: hypothetical protein M9924_21945 [Rhizobiaceae bacterium]|nr:hypothetical protein [Rhizobiaceae bacterium]
MNQTVTLSLTGLVSLIVGAAGSYAYTNSIQANKLADLTGQIATLQKKVDDYEAAAKVEAPSNEEALAAVRKRMMSGSSLTKANIDQCQKDSLAPGAVTCSLTVSDDQNLTFRKVFHFVKIDGVWTAQN